VWRPAYEVVRGGYSWNLWRDASRSGDSRLELEARAVLTQRNVESGGEVFGTSPDNENAFLLSAGWVRRSSFGTLRLGVGYSWGD